MLAILILLYTSPAFAGQSTLSKPAPIYPGTNFISSLDNPVPVGPNPLIVFSEIEPMPLEEGLAYFKEHGFTALEQADVFSPGTLDGLNNIYQQAEPGRNRLYYHSDPFWKMPHAALDGHDLGSFSS